MYEIVNLDSMSQKMKHVLKEMTSIKHRQLEISELEQIYLNLIKMINIKNCHSDFFKDVSKSLFIINHYYQMENNQYLLLESLHLCKLNMMHNANIRKTLDACINIVGNFAINSDLIQIVTNLMLITENYLKTMCPDKISKDMFFNFIKTSINAGTFKNSSFCLSIESYLDDMEESEANYWTDLFNNIKTLLEDSYNYWNYSAFISWYTNK